MFYSDYMFERKWTNFLCVPKDEAGKENVLFICFYGTIDNLWNKDLWSVGKGQNN